MAPTKLFAAARPGTVCSFEFAHSQIEGRTKCSAQRKPWRIFQSENNKAKSTKQSNKTTQAMNKMKTMNQRNKTNMISAILSLASNKITGGAIALLLLAAQAPASP